MLTDTWFFTPNVKNIHPCSVSILICLNFPANLDKLICNPPTNKNLTFRISAGITSSETPDEKALLGELKEAVLNKLPAFFSFAP